MSTEAQLVDLPQQQKPRPNICSPKVIILSILALYFASNNLYHYITLPAPVNPEPTVEVDQWQQFWQLYDKFQSYLYITVICFIIFYYLRRENDRIQEQKYLKQLKKEEQIELQEQQKQHQREKRILKKLEQEQRETELRQYRKTQEANAQKNTNNQNPSKQDEKQNAEYSKKND